MTFFTLDQSRSLMGLDTEDRRALAALAERAAALKPVLRAALVIRLQLAGLLAGYVLTALAIVAGLLSLIGRF